MHVMTDLFSLRKKNTNKRIKMSATAMNGNLSLRLIYALLVTNSA